ncbi:MAG: hypothetical protein MHMPM18_003583 [Marteilia pararefringens]
MEASSSAIVNSSNEAQGVKQKQSFIGTARGKLIVGSIGAGVLLFLILLSAILLVICRRRRSEDHRFSERIFRKIKT